MSDDTPTTEFPIDDTTAVPTSGAEPSGAAGGPEESTGTQPPVYSAATAPAPAPAKEGVRVALLVWAGILAVLGVLFIVMAMIETVDATLLAIALLAVLGVGLIVAAAVSARHAGQQ